MRKMKGQMSLFSMLTTTQEDLLRSLGSFTWFDHTRGSYVPMVVHPQHLADWRFLESLKYVGLDVDRRTGLLSVWMYFPGTCYLRGEQ